MGEWKRTTAHPNSSLLCLPPELRHMIWEAVVDTDPILLYEISYWQDALVQVTAFRSIALPPTYIDEKCRRLHQRPEWPTVRPPRKRAKIPGPLSWLRTNRQIYNEARPVVYTNFNLHICDSLVLLRFLSSPPSKSMLRPSMIRSLSFCVKIRIISDLRDGFSFVRELDHACDVVGRSSGGGECWCSWCFALSTPGSVTADLTDQLSASLRELRFHIYFVCQPRQGNDRPVRGQLADGRPRKGHLYRPKNPTPLRWAANKGASAEDLAKNLCDLMPFRIFSQGGKIQSTDVRFCTERIEHDRRNTCRHPRDRCWCIRRSIDEEALPRITIAREIEKRMVRDSARKE